MANNIQPEMIRTTKNQRERFAYALEQVVGKDHVRDGIGTLSEKTVHAVLKDMKCLVVELIKKVFGLLLL